MQQAIEDGGGEHVIVEDLASIGDPLIAHETQTVAELVRADERLGAAFSAITLPVLILHGTADRAARASGSQAFFEAVGSTDKTLKLYDGVYHDPLNDEGKERVMTDITAWIDARLSTGGHSGSPIGDRR